MKGLLVTARRSILVVLLLVSFFVGSAAASYAYGVQNHAVNNVRHGCPYDNGCTGATNYNGDYNRHGYTRTDNGGGAAYLRANIYYIPNGGYRAGNACYGCLRTDTTYDTNPASECKYRTLHVATNPNLNEHNHYTESAIC